VGRSYDAICNNCRTKFQVNKGSGMIAMPFHCDRCGKEWWWEFGPQGPMGKEPPNPTCDCGGSFTEEAEPRCPRCRSENFGPDLEGTHILYD
jgi:hypothetical protein